MFWLNGNPYAAWRSPTPRCDGQTAGSAVELLIDYNSFRAKLPTWNIFIRSASSRFFFLPCEHRQKAITHPNLHSGFTVFATAELIAGFCRHNRNVKSRHSLLQWRTGSYNIVAKVMSYHDNASFCFFSVCSKHWSFIGFQCSSSEARDLIIFTPVDMLDGVPA